MGAVWNIVFAALVCGNIEQYHAVPVDPEQRTTLEQPSTRDLQRIDCIPEAKRGVDKVSPETCQARGCVYNESTFQQIPTCFYPQSSYGYMVVERSDTVLGFSLRLSKVGPFPFPGGIQNITFEVEERDDHLLRIKITDTDLQRYTVPMTLDMPTVRSTQPLYNVTITGSNPFSFQIIRRSTGTVIWDTSVGGLVFSDQFLQIATMLPSSNVYGLGENQHHSFRHDLNYQAWPMFARDQPPAWAPNSNLYGVHPFYTCVEDDGNTHGVFILNSNAQEYGFTPAPMLTYRSVGGILDVYVFMGPEPETVIKQYTQAVGRPNMPPYWALGFQQSRYGYTDVQSVKAAVDRTRNAGIPLDVQYVDIDYMDERKDFTIDPDNFANLSSYFHQLRMDGMRTIIILDPCLVSNLTSYEPYELIKAANASIRWPGDFDPPTDSADETKALLGYVWPKGKVVFPDFLNKKARDVWKQLIVKLRNQLPFDGLWINIFGEMNEMKIHNAYLWGLFGEHIFNRAKDMNEPASFGTNEEKPFNWPDKDKPYWSLKCGFNRWDNPPYRPLAAHIHDDPKSSNVDRQRAQLSDKTICMNAVQGLSGNYRHYDVHNLYGWSQTQPTLEALRTATNSRSVVISRSTFPGSGKYAGHWLGDNESSWPQLRYSIIGAMEFNLFGIPYIGADICGFMGNTTAELCKRWMQLGAFYTFSRNHNGIGSIDQDPAALGDDVAQASAEALRMRYYLLPYLYTLFHKAHTRGGTVIRPLHHEFPKDKTALGIDRQFMWGPALLISPILEEGQTNLTMYFPAAKWYSVGGQGGVEDSKEATVTIPVGPDDPIPLHIRGGYILPVQESANNTFYSRKTPLSLLAALDESDHASGDLFWDDGESIHTYEHGQYLYAQFEANKDTMYISVLHNGLPESNYLTFGGITVLGVQQVDVTNVMVNNIQLTRDQYEFSPDSKTLVVRYNMLLGGNITIKWSSVAGPDKVDCLPDIINRTEKFTDAAKAICLMRGCVWSTKQLSMIIGPSPCYVSTATGYEMTGSRKTEKGERYFLKKIGTSSMFGGDFKTITLDVEQHHDDVVRFKFDTTEVNRYKVPIDLNLPDVEVTDHRYLFKVTNYAPFSFQIIRKSTGTVIWDTGVGGLVFADQFLQISTALPSTNVYGLGENVHHTLRHDLVYQRWGAFARDQPPGWGDNLNLYGVHPFYTCVEEDGNSHGVLLLNSNAQDYSLSPLPMLTYRTTGGVLDFYMFMGPHPENVIQQYTGMIGRSLMPPYWALGFQLSRYNYTGIDDVKAVVDRTRAAGIPQDIQYADIDYMDGRKDFTVDNDDFQGLNTYFKQLQQDGMRTIVILDPCIISNVTGYEPYEKFKAAAANVRWPADSSDLLDSTDSDGSVLGYVWPKGKVIFPDFFQNASRQTWMDLIVKFHKTVSYDGLWIDMNEPANFGTNEEKPFNWPEDVKPYWSLKCRNNTLDEPPYKTMATYIHDTAERKATFPDKTLCMTAVQGEQGQYRHYDVHSLYGWSQSPPTLEGARRATGERSIVISRSTFPGSGKYTGHWLGDNDSTWSQLRASVIGIMEFNLFGIPYIGADICGFWQTATAELCKRWMQLGAFYTFSRNHNGEMNPPQDPAAFGGEVEAVSRDAITARYWLLPYLYTLFYNAHVHGNTVIRPVHHEFFTDTSTFEIHEQFLWGPALLISPILYQGQTSITLYLPINTRWYEFFMGGLVSAEGGVNITLPVESRTGIPLHARGGYIIPLQRPANNTHYSRQNAIWLAVYLDNLDTDGGAATGELFWDDGVSIKTITNEEYYYSKFSSDNTQLAMAIQHMSSAVRNLTLENIVICGVKTNVKSVLVTGKSGNAITHRDFHYDAGRQVLNITGLNLNMMEDFQMEWTDQLVPDSRKRSVPDALRIDCIPDYSKHSNLEQECHRRQCTWDTHTGNYKVPSCLIDNSKYGYSLHGVTQTAHGSSFDLRKRSSASMFGEDRGQIKLDFEMLSDTTFRLKFYDPTNSFRYEVPIQLNKPSASTSHPLYSLKHGTTSEGFFYVQVIRKSTNKVIWDTTIGGLIFSEQFLQIATKLPSSNIYGFGENRHYSFRHSMDYKEWPMFARDQGPGWADYSNLYGVHPFYTCLEDNSGNAHGVFLLNSNAQEYHFHPYPALTYRTIGGILDFYFFLGPEPESVIKQYTGLIGKPIMPPYWGLGFQLSRYGYNSLNKMKTVYSRTIQAQIPYDVQFADIDYMDERKDFTYDHHNFAGFPDFIREIHGKGMKFIIILDPAIISTVNGYRPYELGHQKDIFVKWPRGMSPDYNLHHTDDMIGYVWPAGETVFPDFLNPKAQDVWKTLIKENHKELEFDGLWIDMNEPSNFGTNEQKPQNWPQNRAPWSLKCPNNKWDDPPYKPRAVNGNRLSTKTLCMVGLQNNGHQEYRHYDVHSLYGYSETKPTLDGLQLATNKRGLVISRSTFAGSGRYGYHWLGDNDSKWSELKDSVIGMLEFNLFGMPYIGADICGFGGVTTAEMCERWMQLGAFYPFCRNHNSIDNADQDPVALGHEVTDSSKRVLEIRYELLPYLYTLFYRAHVDGTNVVRSMMQEFPRDQNTWAQDEQFMWGSAFLIAPVLKQGATTKEVYLPSDIWYDRKTGNKMVHVGQSQSVSAPRDVIPLYFRGGHIVPTQQHATNTHLSRQNPVGLTIVTDDNGHAQGELFWDDGDSIDTIEHGNYWLFNFVYQHNTLTMTIVHQHAHLTLPKMDTLRILGVQSSLSSVHNGGHSISTANVHYFSGSKVVQVSGLGLSMTSAFTITLS